MCIFPAVLQVPAAASGLIASDGLWTIPECILSIAQGKSAHLYVFPEQCSCCCCGSYLWRLSIALYEASSGKDYAHVSEGF